MEGSIITRNRKGVGNQFGEESFSLMKTSQFVIDKEMAIFYHNRSFRILDLELFIITEGNRYRPVFRGYKEERLEFKSVALVGKRL